MIDATTVYSAVVERYFTVEQFEQNGYLSAITYTPEISHLKDNCVIRVINYVSKETDVLYDSPWVNTAGIFLFDLSTSFRMYKTEQTDKETNPTRAGDSSLF